MDEQKARADIETMNQKADYLTDQSVDSTRRMRAMVEESGMVGTQTLVTLHDQGEQLDKIEGNLENMDADLKAAEKDLNQMEKCCGLCLCRCCCNRGNDFGRTQGDLHKMAYGKDNNNKSSVVTAQPTGSARGAGGAGGPMVQRVLNDAREDEMDKNLGDVSSMLGNLKNMALDMGNELERQNDQLDRINTKADSNDVRLSMANDQAQRIRGK
eukprot:scpid88622/ scgid28011/ Synaptosomal-associated protein 25; Super protein; Synaptosomal-associated 25 kDa protein &gt; Synaptosomal-associated protein 25; Synaptosomal-associated 25 kDa protein &gt; Synaptosomal-associated protein 25; Super protein; Synaptosomal-associated 25 kDa protein &gt; Synaptosomal-associated protein 25; Super protein; Synaptosomal-associated 25 kDa protein &gt; Synaptosomal-associated protein 25; Super protein; Synaptosomal-associated 25 kDa protein &gt; Synaptosomal-ass